MDNWPEDILGNSDLPDAQSAPAQDATDVLYPNAQALKALPHEVKTKLFPAPENWGTVDPIYAIGLVRDDDTRFFEFQRGSWQEIPRPLTLNHKNWVCVQRLNKPVRGAGGTPANAAMAAQGASQSDHGQETKPDEPVIINEAAAPERTFTLTLAYTDENGEPMENTDYKVELDTGQIIKGTLDKNGQCVISDLPASIASITYAPRASELTRLRGELNQALTDIIDEVKQRAAIEQAIFDEETAINKGLIMTGAVMMKMWNGTVSVVNGVIEAGGDIVEVAGELARLQLEFYQRLLAGEALEMLAELYVKIAELAGVATDLARQAWHVLQVLARDAETWQMLLNFPKNYFAALSTVGKVELFGAVGFEIIFGIACAAATALTAGAAASLVAGVAALRSSRFITPLVNAVRQIWRLLDRNRIQAPRPQQRIDADTKVISQQQRADTDLPEVNTQKVDSNQDANGNACTPENKTKCAGEPINMASGEELYHTTDFSIPGVIPISFVRQYRTTLCRQRTSLGYGWSHSFSEYFKLSDNDLVLVDQEFLSTHFGPVKRHTFVRNQLGMTLYWGDDEITLKHNGVVKRFRQLTDNGQFTLTHIETIDRQQAWRFSYEQVNGELQPTKVVATWGDELTLNYGKYGLANIDWQAASGHTQRLARYMVDDQGDLIAARNQAGRLEQYRYQQHTITLRKLATGAIYDFEWTELGPKARATRQQERGGSYHYQFEWQLEDNISRSIDSNGVVIEYEFNEQAHLIRQTMPDGSEERWHYNSLGDLLWHQNGNGERTQYAYDDQQRLTKQINALGQQTRISYLGNTFLPTRIINAAGQTTRYQYNSLEQLTAIHHPDGRQARWVYQGGQLAKQIDANGQVHHYLWHPQWGAIARYLQTTSKGELLSELAFGYDEQGRLVSQTVVGKNGVADKTSHFVYDQQGQLVSQIDPFGKSQKLKYDSFGRVIAHIDAAGRTTQFEYGKFAQVERLIQPDGNQVRYEYDKERNLTALINQNGQAHKFEYDVHERISREVTVDGRTTDYTYDGAGRLTKLIERGMREGDLTATFERNALGMLIRAQHQAAGKQSVTIDYQYDELNRLVMADNGHAQTELNYDLAGRLTQELNRQSFNPFGQRAQPHQHKIGIHYRADGLVSHLHHESFKPKPKGLKYGFMHSDGRKDEWYQEYHWNNQQQLVGMLLNNEQLFSQQFNAEGQLSKRQQGAHQLEFSYDPESRLAQTKRLGSAHELIQQRDYGYDEFGRLEQISEQGAASAKPFVKQYQYDAVDRLTSVVRGESGDLVKQQINQDKAGNLLPEGLTELTNNQLPFWGDRHFNYDSHGNLKTETSGANGCKKKQFFYNAKHQLVALLQSVDRTATLYSEYLYDALGRRIEKIVWQLDVALTGVETELELAELARSKGEVVNHERFAWQGSTLVHVRKLTNGGNQQLTAERYIYEPGTHVPLAMHDTELGTLHFDVDHLGTPKGLFDSAGEKLWQAEHAVYGQIESERSFKLHPVTGEQVAPKLRFQGQYEDTESGLFYNLNRYYDAEVGRYTTQDPIGLLGGLNAYQYCPNPVGWVDPLGLACKEIDIEGLKSRISNDPERAYFEIRQLIRNGDLDFSTNEDGAVFWGTSRHAGTNNMLNAQKWASENGKTTLEQTRGGKILEELELFSSDNEFDNANAAKLWNMASTKFAQGANGDINVFNTGANRFGEWGERTWWRIEKPILLRNESVNSISVRKQNGEVANVSGGK